MDLTSIIVQLVIGAIGGNGAGQLLGKIMAHPVAADAAAAATTGGIDWVQSIAGGGIGGAVVMVVVGVIKGMMNKTA
jgi:hypothetical protein